MSHICQWCFEEPAIEGKKICQACLDSSLRELQENQDFDLDKWLEGDKTMKTCADCVFACVSADNETCERFKDTLLFAKKENTGEILSNE